MGEQTSRRSEQRARAKRLGGTARQGSLVLAIVLLALTVAPARAQSEGEDDTIISGGDFHTCALNTAGAVDCWGLDNFGQAVDHAGPYIQISAGGLHTCALTPDSAVDCWGNDDFDQATGRAGPYLDVSSGFDYNCALTPDGTPDCWGHNDYEQTDSPAGPFVRISAGGQHVCALTTAGAAECWGRNDSGQADDQPGPYIEVSAGGQHTCALTAGGVVDCWGNNDDLQSTDQSGPYSQLSAGNAHTCALTSAGVANCWGRADEIQPAQVEPYSLLSTGARHNCALTRSGAADCWGNNDSGQADDQPGPYAFYDDPTAPAAGPTLSPPPNAAGWNNSVVTVNWNWRDVSGSGLDPSACSPSSVSGGEGIQTLNTTCRDKTGSIRAASATVRVDTTAPTLQPVVTPNPVVRGGTATVAPNAADALSGLAAVSCGPLDTSSAGTRNVTCTATDVAGNTAGATVQYTVSATSGGPRSGKLQLFIPSVAKR